MVLCNGFFTPSKHLDFLFTIEYYKTSFLTRRNKMADVLKKDKSNLDCNPDWISITKVDHKLLDCAIGYVILK